MKSLAILLALIAPDSAQMWPCTEGAISFRFERDAYAAVWRPHTRI